MHKGFNLLKIIILKEKKYTSNFLLHFLLCYFFLNIHVLLHKKILKYLS